jgi:hypothetical protein
LTFPAAASQTYEIASHVRAESENPDIHRCMKTGHDAQELSSRIAGSGMVLKPEQQKRRDAEISTGTSVD